MRATMLFLLSLTAMAVAGSARAEPLVLPQIKPSEVDAYNSRRIELPWVNETPVARVAERPIGEIISQRLGLVNGSAELFRYQVQGAPSDKTMLDGVIDGGGIKLKLTW